MTQATVNGLDGRARAWAALNQARRACGFPVASDPGSIDAAREALQEEVTDRFPGEDDRCSGCDGPLPEVIQRAMAECPYCLEQFEEPGDGGVRPGDYPPGYDDEDDDETKGRDGGQEDPVQTQTKAKATTAKAKKNGAQASTALATTQQPGKVTTWSPEDLEKTTRELQALGKTYQTHSWELGQKLRSARDSGVWEVGGFKTFDDYVEREVGFSAAWWQPMVRAADKYTKETFAAIGASNARTLLRLADDGAREKWVKKLLDTPMTTRQLEEKIKAEVRSAGGGRVARKPKAARANASVTLNDLNDKWITVKMAGTAGEKRLGGKWRLLVDTSHAGEVRVKHLKDD